MIIERTTISLVKNNKININVKATIKQQQNAPLLLGQSAIEKLGKITIDGYKLIIHKAR